MSDILRTVGCLRALMRIADAGKSRVDGYHPITLAHLERTGFIAIVRDQVVITGAGANTLTGWLAGTKTVTARRDLEARRARRAADVSAMSRTAAPPEPNEKRGPMRHPTSKWFGLGRCRECGVDAGLACRNQDDEVQLCPCVGRKRR